MKTFSRLLAVWLLVASSSAQAFSPYLGLQLNLPGLFGNYGGPGVPLFGVRIGVDFEAPNSGFGARISASNLLLILAIRVDAGAYYRIPLEANGGNLYLGGGVALWGPLFVGGGWADAHGLVGYEAPVLPGLTGYVEVAPGIVFQGGRYVYAGPPDPMFQSYAGQPAITLTVGLNFRM